MELRMKRTMQKTAKEQKIQKFQAVSRFSDKVTALKGKLFHPFPKALPAQILGLFIYRKRLKPEVLVDQYREQLYKRPSISALAQ